MKQKNKLKVEKKVCPLTKKGFSLVESLLAIFIFSLAITMLSGSFASFLKNYAAEKKSQKGLENAQYALNLMEKTIRTSIVSTKGPSTSNNTTSLATLSPTLDFGGVDGNLIKLYDNSQVKCVVYRYNSNKLQIATLASPDMAGCGDFSTVNSFSDLTSADITNVQVYGWASAVGVAGKVGVAFTVMETGQTSPIHINMTSSLRSFQKAP